MKYRIVEKQMTGLPTRFKAQMKKWYGWRDFWMDHDNGCILWTSWRDTFDEALNYINKHKAMLSCTITIIIHNI